MEFEECKEDAFIYMEDNPGITEDDLVEEFHGSYSEGETRAAYKEVKEYLLWEGIW